MIQSGETDAMGRPSIASCGCGRGRRRGTKTRATALLPRVTHCAPSRRSRPRPRPRQVLLATDGTALACGRAACGRLGVEVPPDYANIEPGLALCIFVAGRVFGAAFLLGRQKQEGARVVCVCVCVAAGRPASPDGKAAAAAAATAPAGADAESSATVQLALRALEARIVATPDTDTEHCHGRVLHELSKNLVICRHAPVHAH